MSDLQEPAEKAWNAVYASVRTTGLTAAPSAHDLFIAGYLAAAQPRDERIAELEGVLRALLTNVERDWRGGILRVSGALSSAAAAGYRALPEGLPEPPSSPETSKR